MEDSKKILLDWYDSLGVNVLVSDCAWEEFTRINGNTIDGNHRVTHQEFVARFHKDELEFLPTFFTQVEKIITLFSANSPLLDDIRFTGKIGDSILNLKDYYDKISNSLNLDPIIKLFSENTNHVHFIKRIDWEYKNDLSDKAKEAHKKWEKDGTGTDEELSEINPDVFVFYGRFSSVIL